MLDIAKEGLEQGLAEYFERLFLVLTQDQSPAALERFKVGAKTGLETYKKALEVLNEG